MNFFRSVFVTLSTFTLISGGSLAQNPVRTPLLSCRQLVGDLDANVVVKDTIDTLKHLSEMAPLKAIDDFKAKHGEFPSEFLKVISKAALIKNMGPNEVLNRADGFLSRKALKNLNEEDRAHLFEIHLFMEKSLDSLETAASDFSSSNMKKSSDASFLLTLMATYSKSSGEITRARAQALDAGKTAIKALLDGMVAKGEMSASARDTEYEGASLQIEKREEDFLHPAMLALLESDMDVRELSDRAKAVMTDVDGQSLFREEGHAFLLGGLIHPIPLQKTLARVKALSHILDSDFGSGKFPFNSELSSTVLNGLIVSEESPEDVAIILKKLAGVPAIAQEAELLSVFMQRLVINESQSKAAILLMLSVP